MIRALALALLLVAGVAEGGQLDASWTAPTTNTDGSPITGPLTYHVYWVLFPQTPCPGTQFIVTNPNVTSANLGTLTQGMTYNVQATAVNANSQESACSGVASAAARASAPPPPTVTFGETAILAGTDFNDANFLFAQQATLATAGTLTSLSFHVRTPAGSLRLGLYSNVNNAPGAKLAETAAITPVAGWNAVAVTPVALAAGTYWLAFVPSSQTLAMPKDQTGSHVVVAFPFGAMPATFPAGASANTAHWSFFGTVTTTPGLPTPGTTLQIRFVP